MADDACSIDELDRRRRIMFSQPTSRTPSRFACPRLRRTPADGGRTSGRSAIGTHTSGARPRTGLVTSGGDPHDGVGLSIQDDGPANNPRVVREMRRPETVCNHGHADRTPGTIFISVESAPRRDRHTQHVEVVSADNLASDRQRLASRIEPTARRQRTRQGPRALHCHADLRSRGKTMRKTEHGCRLDV